MISVNDLKPNSTFEFEGNVYQVLDTLHNKTAMRQMVIKLKVKNLRSGAITDMSFTGGDKVETARMDKKEMQYLYKDAEDFVFMDNETYEQVYLHESRLEWEKKFLRENANVEITYYQDEIMGITLPAKVTLTVTSTEPAVRGDTARSATKDATLETGLTVRVPLFIEEGEEVLVRTDTGEYDSRA